MQIISGIPIKTFDDEDAELAFRLAVAEGLTYNITEENIEINCVEEVTNSTVTRRLLLQLPDVRVVYLVQTFVQTGDSTIEVADNIVASIEGYAASAKFIENLQIKVLEAGINTTALLRNATLNEVIRIFPPAPFESTSTTSMDAAMVGVVTAASLILFAFFIFGKYYYDTQRKEKGVPSKPRHTSSQAGITAALGGLLESEVNAQSSHVDVESTNSQSNIQAGSPEGDSEVPSVRLDVGDISKLMESVPGFNASMKDFVASRSRSRSRSRKAWGNADAKVHPEDSVVTEVVPHANAHPDGHVQGDVHADMNSRGNGDSYAIDIHQGVPGEPNVSSPRRSNIEDVLRTPRRMNDLSFDDDV